MCLNEIIIILRNKPMQNNSECLCKKMEKQKYFCLVNIPYLLNDPYIYIYIYIYIEREREKENETN